MRLVFVMGPAMSGKTIYANTHFPGAEHIAVQNFSDVLSAAESNNEIDKIAENIEAYCRDTLTERIQAVDDDAVIVFEHPMLTKADRAFFIKGVREVTDAPIECILMSPDEETLHKMLFGQTLTIKLYEFERSKLEMPTVDEGFVSVKEENPILIYEYMNEPE